MSDRNTIILKQVHDKWWIIVEGKSPAAAYGPHAKEADAMSYAIRTFDDVSTLSVEHESIRSSDDTRLQALIEAARAREGELVYG